ncbi:superoxide dismutase [Leptolyngbya valderiana BDU 20041]|nr:superoxide dismutase [Geitlerinema sp. CS-897]OAB60211.1 superoxide dismutase [Leptolyngbya valderiana BDU 20041]PPT07408.1 Superoxide dismutase [Geitlerinema sp. FC II]
MAFTLPELPYAKDALAPHISAQTLEFHYGKHHAGYVKKLNAAIEGTDMADKSLEDIIKATAGDPEKSGVFNNAAQVWNHTFYWQCMKPGGGGKPTGALAQKIDAEFGSFDNFISELKSAAGGQFGSGWAWLVQDGDSLKVVKTPNAENPMTEGHKPLLTIDVWEHAYYLDYQNLRPNYIDTFLNNLVSWDFVASNMA